MTFSQSGKNTLNKNLSNGFNVINDQNDLISTKQLQFLTTPYHILEEFRSPLYSNGFCLTRRTIH